MEMLMRYPQNKREFSPRKISALPPKVVDMQRNATTMADEKARAVGPIRLHIIKRIELTTLFAT
jgi:hypothetical protein